MNKLLKFLKKCWPYLLLLIFSLFGTYLVFYKGLNTGDDYYFHLGNILDQYESLINGYSLNPISGNLAMGLGVGNRLFYSPLPHFTVAILGVFLNFFGLSLINSYKLVIVFSVFISGVFMYRFALHFTKGNKVAALLAGACFVLYPYRLFDAFCRLAFAEAFCFIFLPLFFMGLYDITHFEDKKIKTLPFIEVILGGALLYLSHNITALFSFIAGVIYLLCNIKNILRLIKKPKYISYCIASIFLLIGIASIALFSQFELMGTNLYNITDNVRMWTNVEQVINRTKEEFNYSGFLNLPYLNSNFSHIVTLSSLVIGIVMYIISCIIFIIVDQCLAESKKLKHFHLIISGTILFVLMSLMSRRIEAYLGAIIFYMLYIYITYNFKKVNEIQKENKIYKNTLFWFCLSMIVLAIMMMEEGWVWKILPQIMLNIQFPWRLWALVQLFASVLIGLLSYYYDYKKVTPAVLSILVGLLMVTNMPLIEKRLNYETNFEKSWQTEITDLYLDVGSTLGHNKEYIPQKFFDNSYESKYNNSLYYKIKPKLPYSFTSYEDYYYDPVILEGKGNIVVNKCFAPIFDMSVTLYENSLIQMPLIYYPGYEITIVNEQTLEKTKVNGIEVDGLVAFSLQEGKYNITTDYVGTSLRQSSIAIFGISLAITSLGIVYAIFIENEKYKKLFIKQNKDRVCN